VEGLADHTKLISKDGDEHQIADSAAPIKDDQGNILGVVVIFRDVTEEYKKNQQIKESRDFLDAVFQSIQDGISVLNTDLTIRYVNPVMETWYSEDMPLIGRKCYNTYHHAAAPCDPCPSIRCMKTKKTESEIIPGSPDPNSPAKWLELYSYPLVDSDSCKVTGVVEFVRDISRRVKDRRQLTTQKERLANILEGTDAGTWEWNVQTGETVFNERCLCH
ncbi:MAG: PAS domain-containing protein, partial [Bacteroidales bacterium]